MRSFKNMFARKSVIYSLLIALITIIVDQVTKYIVIEKFTQLELKQLIVNDYFNLVLVWNKGISFGLFNGYDYSNYIFLLLSSAIIVFLLYWLLQTKKYLEFLGLGLIIGGAIGNILDRMLHEAVADFLQFHYETCYWPAFNIADSAIFAGVILLFVDSIIVEVRKISKKGW
jgi:signal peptidase II